MRALPVFFTEAGCGVDVGGVGVEVGTSVAKPGRHPVMTVVERMKASASKKNRFIIFSPATNKIAPIVKYYKNSQIGFHV